MENGETLTKVKTSYTLVDNTPIDILVAVSNHYHGILEQEKGKGIMSKNLNPREVGRVIRSGYDTLVLPNAEGMALDGWDKWREGDERGMLKRVGRVAVEDVRRWVKELK